MDNRDDRYIATGNAISESEIVKKMIHLVIFQAEMEVYWFFFFS